MKIVLLLLFIHKVFISDISHNLIFSQRFDGTSTIFFKGNDEYYYYVKLGLMGSKWHRRVGVM